MSRDSLNRLGSNRSEQNVGLATEIGLSLHGAHDAMCRSAGKQLPASPRAGLPPLPDQEQTPASARQAETARAVVWAGGWHTHSARHRGDVRVHGLPGTAWAALVLSKFTCC